MHQFYRKDQTSKVHFWIDDRKGQIKDTAKIIITQVETEKACLITKKSKLELIEIALITISSNSRGEEIRVDA